MPTLTVANVSSLAVLVRVIDRVAAVPGAPLTWEGVLNPQGWAYSSHSVPVLDAGGGKGEVAVFGQVRSSDPWTTVEADYSFVDGDPPLEIRLF